MKRPSLALLFLCIPLTASATSFQAGDTIEVETEGNAYAAGSIVQITKRVTGDVYLAGKHVIVNARADEDALLVGEDITINAVIGDDLHAFGVSIVANKPVHGDAMLFGQKIMVGPETQIFGSTVIGGESITAQGRFDEDARLMAADIVIEGGTFGKDLKIHAGKSLKISEDTIISGDLHLSVPEGLAVAIPEGVVAGEVKKQYIQEKAYSGGPSFLSQLKFFSLLSRILIGALLIAFARLFAMNYGAGIQKAPWKILGLGFLGMLAPPFIVALLFFPVITIPLALLILVFWGSLLYFASLLAGLLVAQYFFPLQKTDSTWMLIGKFSLGTFIIFLINFVPFIGFPLTLILFVLSVGSLITYYMNASKALRRAKLV